MSQEPIVEIRELSKIYRQGDINVTALNSVSLDIARGEFVVLMGPSGSGKSTLLHIIAGIDRATTGKVLVQGINVANLNESELADWRNQNVGFVFQSFNLIPVLTAFENIELPLLLTALNRRQRREQVQTAMDLVGLGEGTFTGKDPADSVRTTYLTMWKQQPDGAWKVLFDTGRAVNSP